MSDDTHPKRLQRLMEERKLRQADVAQALNESKQNVNKLFSGRTAMSKHWAQRLEPVLGLSWPEIMGFGEAVTAGMPQVEPAARASARARPPNTVTINEYDVSADMGGGIVLADLDGHERHPIIGQWTMPADFMASVMLPGTQLAMIRVVGDSMEPDFHAGDRVLVDVGWRKPTPPGVYVLWDGMGLVLKRCELLMNSDPPRIRISSANPAYETYERLLEEVTINGRVAGKWLWK